MLKLFEAGDYPAGNQESCRLPSALADFISGR
jgi:hypothetical protein